MDLTEPEHNTCLRHDYTANLQLISRPLCVENKELKDKNDPDKVSRSINGRFI